MAARAAGYLGRMYLRGDGVRQDFERAKFWFDRGVKFGDPQSQYGLGLMLLHGYGIPKNVSRAAELFKAAADQDYAPAQVQIGALYLDQGHADDLANANHYFELAARYGNLEAFYYLAEMNLAGVGREKSCSTAVGFYKSVAEKAEPLVSSWVEANIAYEDGDHELAFLEYLGMAEQGYEKAQNNVAYMLDPQQSRLRLPPWLINSKEKPKLLQNPGLALIYWTRSSKQGNIDSLVKVGDYYLEGIGTDADVDKAVMCYAGAAEYQQSAQALYNLGWMHENGVGLNQDFHLAKRYYDSALATNEEAYLPVTLSLLKLRARSAWNTFTHGRVNSIRDEPGMQHSEAKPMIHNQLT
jgi:SEL1 protein